MILSVTLNPCLDKTLDVPAWTVGENVRGTALREVVGGKGNNVARALKRLGRDARPVTFLGGEVGRLCDRLLREQDGLEPITISTASPTRVILTTRTASNDQTAFFDPNPSIHPEEAHELLNAVESRLKSGSVEALTLSGSSPDSSTHGLFGELIAVAKARRVPVFLDTYGPPLEAIWGFRPDVQQFNRREAALSMGLIRADDLQVERLLQDWSRRGVKLGIVTDGPSAAFARWEGLTYRVLPPTIVPVNPIGSGDCLLAGLVDGFLRGGGCESIVRRGVASAVANALVWDAGAIDVGEVARIEPLISIETV